MRQLVLVVILGVTPLTACKSSRSGSDAKGINDVDHTESSDDNMVWIWCKKTPPRSHNGKCKFTMTATDFESQVSNLCEDNPPAACARGGGEADGSGDGGGGGGGGGGGALKVSMCPAAQEKIQGFTVAFSSAFFKEFDADFSDLPDEIRDVARTKGFCGLVDKFGEWIKKNPAMGDFLRGKSVAAPGEKVVIIENSGAAPTYKANQNLLRIPATFDQKTESALTSALSGPDSPCSKPYTTWQDETRNIAYGQGNTCDKQLSGWYRFTGKAGSQIAAQATKDHCNSQGMWYLPPTDIPAPGTPPKNVTFVGNYGVGNNPPPFNGQVVNCGFFFLYKFDLNNTWCNAAICGQ